MGGDRFENSLTLGYNRLIVKHYFFMHQPFWTALTQNDKPENDILLRSRCKF